MESIGEKLRTKREDLGCSLEQIARDTNIAKRYIESLENEDFDVFPGEPYLIGFLRTYSEYLGLIPDEIVGLYKNLKIQEQPVPMEELIERKSRKPLIITLLILVVIGGGVAAGILFLPDFLEDRAERRELVEQQQAEKEPTGTVYEMTDEILERRFLEGDEIVLSVDGESATITLTKVDNRLSIDTPLESLKLKLGEERRVDLNGDGTEDILMYLRDIESDDAQKSVVVRFDKFTQATIAAAERTGEETEYETDVLRPEGENGAAEGRGEVSVPDAGHTDVSSREQRTIVVKESESRGPITVDMLFRGYCLIRYVADNRIREERYFHKGETFRLEANREAHLWLSNAGSVKTTISGEDVDLGRPGEIVTKLITWKENEATNTYQLQIVPVY